MLKPFYLVMAVLGAIIPWTFNILAWQELGAEFTPLAFMLVGFQGSPMLGSLAADFWIGASVASVWMVVEARRLQMRHWWIWIVLTLVVAWACALPLFLYVRETRLARQA